MTKKLLFLINIISVFCWNNFPVFSSDSELEETRKRTYLLTTKTIEDLDKNIPNGQKSKFVDEAVKNALMDIKKESIPIKLNFYPILEEEIFSSKFNEVEKALRNKNYIEVLTEILQIHNSHYNFGTKHLNKESFRNWLISLRILNILSEKDKNYNILLSNEKETKKRYLDNIDCYILGDEKKIKKDYPLYLEGIWNQVACFDNEEREELIKCYESGKNILPKNEKKEEYWRNYAL